MYSYLVLHPIKQLKYNKHHTTGANGGAGTANPSRTIEIIPDVLWDTRSSMFSFLYGVM